jgi:Protein of unknown function (DUF1203)
VATKFSVSALPVRDLERIRARGLDDFNNAVVVSTNQDNDGIPLRCCLREAAVGERVAFIAFQPSAVGGAYAEVGPVFIHADSCAGYEDNDAYPVGFRQCQQLFRAYDVEGRQVDNQIVEGQQAETAIAKLFARPDVAYLHSRNQLAGCYMFAITRNDAAT